MFATALVQPLLDTPVLRILSQLQRNLDTLDIEGLSKLWRKVESAASEHDGAGSASFTPLGQNSPFTQILEPTISDWSDFLDKYLSSERKDMDHGHPSAEDIPYYLFAYLLSATFKDCSIIVRLDFLRPDDSSRQSVKVQPESVTVIDLDPKKLDKLKGWEELDKEIVNEYSTTVEKKICVDEWQHLE
jgi:inositol-pentakisphosphate 2-kinase